MPFRQEDKLLFIGDSITDAGRDRQDTTSLGNGYVRVIANRLAAEAAAGEAPVTVVNRGVNGNRVYDLEDRWTSDVMDAEPSVVTVKIGINDTWRRYDRGLRSPVPDFEACLDRILTRTTENLSPQLFVVTPFLLPVEPGQQEWFEDLAPRIDAVLRVAEAHGAVVIRADVVLPRAATEHGAATLAPDGVHPSMLGHGIIAETWLRAAADDNALRGTAS